MLHIKQQMHRSICGVSVTAFQKDLHSRTGRDKKKGKTQEKMERGSRKRSSSAGSETMERVCGR